MTGPTSKDLDKIAARYRSALAGGDLAETDLSGYDRTGLPGVANVWGEGRGTVHGTGFGRSSQAATVGALGELAEGVLVNRAITALPVRRASYSQLRTELGAGGVVDPVELVLPAGCDYAPDRPLDWAPVQRWRTGEQVFVPVEFIASDGLGLPAQPPPGGWLTTAITNGLGAGSSLAQAVAHGLGELIQRDGDTVSFRALDTGVVVDLAGSTDATTLEILDRFRGVGIEPMVKLASTEFATVVYCVGIDSDPDTPPLTVTAIGEAADLDRDAAIVKALLEYGSSRVRKIFSFGPLEAIAARDPAYLRRELAEPVTPQEPRALAAMTAWSRMTAAELTEVVAPTLFRVEQSVPLDSLPTSEKPADHDTLLVALLDRLSDFDVLVLPAGEEGGMRAAKVLVPGLEVETMSYQRIGERVLRRLLDRGSDLVGPGAPTRAGQLPIVLTDAATDRLGGPAWLDRDAVDRAMGPLYPLYREPDRWAMQRLSGAAG